MTKLSKAQSEALTRMIFFSGKSILDKDYNGGTLKALQIRGLIRWGGDEYEWFVTPAGYEAVGMTPPTTEATPADPTDAPAVLPLYAMRQMREDGSFYEIYNTNTREVDPDHKWLPRYRAVQTLDRLNSRVVITLTDDPIDAPESAPVITDRPCDHCDGEGSRKSPYDGYVKTCSECDGTGIYTIADDTSAGELSVEQRIELAWRDADLAELASLGEPIAPEHVVILGKFATSAYRFIEQLAKTGNAEAQEFVRDANKLQYLPGDASIYSYRRTTSFSMYDMYEVYNVITDEIHPDYTQLEWDDVSRTVYHLNKQS